eukprot:15445800-Alexandrium_andersonii.AAC.1
MCIRDRCWVPRVRTRPDVRLEVAWVPCAVPPDLGRGGTAPCREPPLAALSLGRPPFVGKLPAARLHVNLPWIAVPTQPGVAHRAHDAPAGLPGSRASMPPNAR